MDTVIELLRHAKAQSRDRWWGRPDQERPLTDRGVEQSVELVDLLIESGPVDAVYSSPWTRCIQTVEPLADHRGLPVRRDERLGEVDSLPVHDDGDAWVTSAWLAGRADAFIADILRAHAGQRIVACSHGDVIPASVALIAGRHRLDLTDVACRKGGRFTLTFSGGACTAAVHHEPPS